MKPMRSRRTGVGLSTLALRPSTKAKGGDTLIGRILATGLVISLCMGLLPLTRAKEVEIALEAELANTIQPPMVVGVPEDAKKKGGPLPDDPSRGKFIWVPGAPATGGGDQGFAEFIVNIPKKDTYAIWGRVIAWDGNSDSFWVTVVPPDPEDQNPQQSGDTHYRWAVQQGNQWHWDRINQWLDGGTFDRKWEIPQGEVKITIWTREDATMLDCLFITSNDGAVDPNSANVRTPTDADVEFQKTGGKIAVMAEDKLATIWAKVKRL